MSDEARRTLFRALAMASHAVVLAMVLTSLVTVLHFAGVGLLHMVLVCAAVAALLLPGALIWITVPRERRGRQAYQAFEALSATAALLVFMSVVIDTSAPPASYLPGLLPVLGVLAAWIILLSTEKTSVVLRAGSWAVIAVGFLWMVIDATYEATGMHDGVQQVFLVVVVALAAAGALIVCFAWHMMEYAEAYEDEPPGLSAADQVE